MLTTDIARLAVNINTPQNLYVPCNKSFRGRPQNKKLETIQNIEPHLLAVYYNKSMAQKAAIINFEGQMSVEDRIKKFPEDHNYRRELAKHIRCWPEDLMSVTGTQELEFLLKKLERKNFQPGKNLENFHNGIFKANLHMHTTNSDGKMTVQSLLDQAAKYSKKVKDPPLLVAITNHDILDDAQEALRIISSDPEKFKDVRFIPGVEMSAKYENPELFDLPVQMEILGYCVNPFDEKLNSALASLREQNLRYAGELIEKARTFGIKASFEEAKQYHNLINIGASPGFIGLVKDYLAHKAKQQGVDESAVREIIDDHCKRYGIFPLTPATPEIAEIMETSPAGMYGLSHPGRIELHGLKEGISGEKGIESLLQKFKTHGGRAVEVNYLYPDYYHNEGFDSWLEKIHSLCNQMGFLNSGGVDNHGESIFIR